MAKFPSLLTQIVIAKSQQVLLLGLQGMGVSKAGDGRERKNIFGSSETWKCW